MKTITSKSINLQSTYQKVAEITFQLSFQKWITIAQFFPETRGQVNVFAKWEEGAEKPVEITKSQYAILLNRYAEAYAGIPA